MAFITKHYSFAQCNDLINDLLSNDIPTISMACFNLMEEDCPEVVAVIHNIMLDQPPILQLSLLKVLSVQQDQDIISQVYSFINRSDSFDSDVYPMDPLEAKVEATAILFKYNDYSTFQYVLTLIERDELENKFNPTAFSLLDNIANVYPEYSEYVNQYMNNNQNSNGQNIFNYYSLDYLGQNDYENNLDKLINAFKFSEDLPTRYLAFEYLSTNHYSNLSTLLKEQLGIQEKFVMRVDIVDTLLQNYGRPSDLKTVLDYQPTEPDETSKSLMGYSISTFIPPRPTVTTAEMIDNLISYNNELFQYGWITDYRTYQQYVSLLDKIKSSYRSGSQRDLCTNLSTLLNNVEKHKNTPLLTTEGYKFLYYHGKYIKENVEKEFSSCP